jgi:bifunctional non-homologous end joining protein LigD
LALVRKAAHLIRELLAEHGLNTVPVATGSKGYHVIANLDGDADWESVIGAVQKLAALAVSRHPDVMTVAFRVANRGQRVFVDWMRNAPMATVVAPYSLRAKSNASAAAPLSWTEIDSFAPDHFTIDDADELLERPDSLIDLAASKTKKAMSSIDAAFDRSGLLLETFDRFRS